jgi:hypothetical protein
MTRFKRPLYVALLGLAVAGTLAGTPVAGASSARPADLALAKPAEEILDEVNEAIEEYWRETWPSAGPALALGD